METTSEHDPVPTQADDRRMVLRRAAARLFETRGYHGTSVDEVAAAAGLNKGTLYYYFASKGEILAAIYTDIIEALLEALLAIPDDLPADEALARLIRDQVRLVAENPDEFVVYFQEGRRLQHWLPAKVCREIREREHEHRLLVERIVQRGLDAGTFDGADATVVANALAGMVAWTYQWFTPVESMWPREDLHPAADEISEVFVRLVLSGLVAPPP